MSDDSRLTDSRSEGTPTRPGRRAVMLGMAAAGAGMAAGLVAGADPADAANGGSVLLGKTNTATATTSINTSTGYGLRAESTANGEAGVYGIDDSSTGGYGVFGTSTAGTGVKGTTTATGKDGVQGIDASTGGGHGVLGASTKGTGVTGTGLTGVSGTSSTGTGVSGTTTSNENYGVEGLDYSPDGGYAMYATSRHGIGVGVSAPGGDGVYATTGADGASGVYGYTDAPDTGYGVYGVDGSAGGGYGVYGSSHYGTGVYGTTSNGGAAIYGTTGYGSGVLGITTANGEWGVGGTDESSSGGVGVNGTSTHGHGVAGQSDYGYGVYGTSTNNHGVYGTVNGGGTAGLYGNDSSTAGGYGVNAGSSNNVGVFAAGVTAMTAIGNVGIIGTLSKTSGSFRIDHPLDPAGKYLYHSFVESPDMKNVYDGTVILDHAGRATVELPDWFEALNRDFRYQLTAIGAPGRDLHVASEVSSGRFTIAGGQAGQKVSWQITGIRQDAYANEHRIPVEVAKPADDQGRYLHPELFGSDLLIREAADGLALQREVKSG